MNWISAFSVKKDFSFYILWRSFYIVFLMRILHVISSFDQKFIPPFIDFISSHFDLGEHRFIIFGYHGASNIPHNSMIIRRDRDIFRILAELYLSDKIILHGLWPSAKKLYVLLLMNPWLIKKCYWIMWGADFYPYESRSFVTKLLIRRLKHFLTLLDEDFEYVKKYYRANGYFHRSFVYPSNIFDCDGEIFSLQDEDTDEYEDKKSVFRQKQTNIIIGHSAFAAIKHFEIIEKLKVFRGEKIKIYCPLSYGVKSYADEVVKFGKKVFGENFIPIFSFMSRIEYCRFLSKMDIAIFAMEGSQAMGNLILLLGLGKKVYMRKNPQFYFFRKIGIKIFDFDEDEINLSPLDKFMREKNKSIIKENFSEQRLIFDLNKLFYEW